MICSRVFWELEIGLRSFSSRQICKAKIKLLTGSSGFTQAALYPSNKYLCAAVAPGLPDMPVTAAFGFLDKHNVIQSCNINVRTRLQEAVQEPLCPAGVCQEMACCSVHFQR